MVAISVELLQGLVVGVVAVVPVGTLVAKDHVPLADLGKSSSRTGILIRAAIGLLEDARDFKGVHVRARVRGRHRQAIGIHRAGLEVDASLRCVADRVRLERNRAG